MSAYVAWPRSTTGSRSTCRSCSSIQAARPTEEEASRLEGDLIDLEPVLRDAVVLELPFQPLCRPDCAGLCPECGANLNDDPGTSHDGRPRSALGCAASGLSAATSKLTM